MSNTFEILTTQKVKKTKEYEIREKIKTFNCNIENSQMLELKNKILTKMDEEDKYLINHIINKIWFDITYSKEIELKIEKYIYIT